VLLLAVSALPWFVALGNEVQDIDSAQYADVARLMVRDGQWLTMRDSSGPFINKPPLSIWAQAVAISVLGATSCAAHLPSLLFAVLTVAATFGLGRALLDLQRGQIAACLLASSVALQQMVADPKVDLALTAMATLSLWAFVEGRRRSGFLWLGWLFAGLAVLAKGPLGLALPAAAIFPEAIRHRWGRPEQGTLRQRLFALKPVRGLLIVTALAAPYYWAIYQRDGAANAGFVLWQQNLGRLIGQSGYSNATTPLFFLHTALWVFLPFTPLLALGALRPALPRLASEPRVLWWGFFVPFAAFSASTYKLPQYIYCLAPVAALIAADALVGLKKVQPLRKGMLGLGAVSVLAIAWLLIDAFPPDHLAGVVVALLAAAALPIAAWKLKAEPVWQATASTVAALAAVHLAYVGWLFPQAIAFQPGKAVGDRAFAEDPKATMLPYVDTRLSFAAAYYYRGPRTALIGPEELASHVQQGELSTVVVETGRWPDFNAVGLDATVIQHFEAYPTSRARLPFWRTATRASQLKGRDLLRLKAR